MLLTRQERVFDLAWRRRAVRPLQLAAGWPGRDAESEWHASRPVGRRSLLALGASSAGAETFDILHGFESLDCPNQVIETSDGALYGTTCLGGVNYSGVVFESEKDGSGFLILHEFIGSDGANPYAGLIEASDGPYTERPGAAVHTMPASSSNSTKTARIF
jgi:hypothetical protein